MKNLLKNWRVAESYSGKELQLIGQVYNDSAKRFTDGEWITTSILVETDFKNKTAQTLNTLYNLD